MTVASRAKASVGGRWWFFVFCLITAGCWSPAEKQVVVYTALDSEFSRPILEDFGTETEIEVLPKFDIESTKTVGLTEAILQEKDRPRCDVFWNNEILNTLRLEKAGLLDAYHPPISEKYPKQFRSPDGTWHGFAARARVIIVNTEIVPKGQRPDSILDFADPDSPWKGRMGIAKPLFGTTATHAACLFAYWGDEKAKEYFRALKANDIQIESGNKQVARKVADGDLAFGLTDTDDAIIEKEAGEPVAIVFPDRQVDPETGEEPIGTLFIPNTVAIIKGSPNPEAARRLVDYLLTPEVEKRLAEGPSAQFPLHSDVEVESRVAPPNPIQAMKVDFRAAADKWETARQFIRDEFTGG